ncbi:hypothetical protein [Flavobacterium sp. C3NV]|uniref:hypothetical protein n=1 Tax=Flavobacterium sp. C3NV TaxID=3393358 RepID=UPI00398FAAFF
MKVKIAISVVVFFLIVFYSLMQINFLDYESPKKYDEIDEITFNDFKGLEFFQNSLYGNKHFAYIKTSINYQIEEDSVKVESFFHPSSSYVYKKDLFSKELLTHELYHFKITELFSRMIKKKIFESKNRDNIQIENLINELKIKERQFQFKYDDDTFHSYVFSEQKKYQNDIDSLLNLHSNFKNPKVYINEK